MKLTAKLMEAQDGSDSYVALVGDNGDEVARVQTNGGENLTIEEYRRIDDAIAALINREGLEI